MRIRQLLAPGLVTFAIALLASGVLHRQVPEGLPVTPELTLVLVPVTRLFMFTTGAVAFGGALVVAAIGGDAALLRVAARAAGLYAFGSASVALLALADVLARQWWGALDLPILRSFLTQIDEGRYLVLQTAIGAFAAWLLSKAQHALDVVFAAVALALAVALPAFTGHSAAAVPHWLASATMLVHLPAMSAWLGGVGVLLLAPTRAAVLGFGRLASVALPAVLISGVASAVTRINDWASLPHDPYTLVLLIKVLGTAGVVWFAAQNRRTIADLLTRDSSGRGVEAAIRRTLAIEGSLMFVVLGFAVVLARMPNP